jgi:molybdenum cofactor cytidylyltransferase
MSTPAASPPFAVVLTAAGESTRMGQPKQLLDWHGAPLIQYQVRQLQETTAGEIVVVLGHEAERIRPLVAQVQDSRVRIVINNDYPQGKTTSIKAGLDALEGNPDTVMLLAVDQPRPADVLQRLIEEHHDGGNLISVPSHQGKHGHPPIFSTVLLPELLAITEEDRGLLRVVEGHRGEVRKIAFKEAIVLTNLNTPEDYNQALELSH